MILEVQVKTVYGVDRIYPMNDTAKKLAVCFNRKTFDKELIGRLKDVGFTIKWVPIELPLPNT